MKVLISGGTGLVGRYIVETLLSAGYSVTVGGRHPPAPDTFSKPVAFQPLSLDPDLDQIDAFDDAYFFVHAAFDHIPGKYRGGEGNDPQTFRRMNVDGSVKLFDTAKRAGTRRCIFVSSRAAYGDMPAGTVLSETMIGDPSTLYGQAKLCTERALADLAAPGFVGASLRLTGVYGDLRPNKWDGLFADYLSGRPIASRAGSEVHGRDVGAAVSLMLEVESSRISGQIFNVSDIVTDTRTILGELQQQAGCPHPLPPLAENSVNEMATDKLRSLGWQPGGKPLLDATLQRLAADPTPHSAAPG